MKASKPVLSLHSRHKTTQEELINGVVDDEGVNGDNRKQPALLRLALDDVVSVTTQPLEIFFFDIALFTMIGHSIKFIISMIIGKLYGGPC